jgi:hypothetical protein
MSLIDAIGAANISSSTPKRGVMVLRRAMTIMWSRPNQTQVAFRQLGDVSQWLKLIRYEGATPCRIQRHIGAHNWGVVGGPPRLETNYQVMRLHALKTKRDSSPRTSSGSFASPQSAAPRQQASYKFFQFSALALASIKCTANATA